MATFHILQRPMSSSAKSVIGYKSTTKVTCLLFNDLLCAENIRDKVSRICLNDNCFKYN